MFLSASSSLDVDKLQQGAEQCSAVQSLRGRRLTEVGHGGTEGQGNVLCRRW